MNDDNNANLKTFSRIDLFHEIINNCIYMDLHMMGDLFHISRNRKAPYL